MVDKECGRTKTQKAKRIAYYVRQTRELPTTWDVSVADIQANIDMLVHYMPNHPDVNDMVKWLVTWLRK